MRSELIYQVDCSCGKAYIGKLSNIRDGTPGNRYEVNKRFYYFNEKILIFT